MNAITRDIASLGFQFVGDKITRVTDPRVPHEVTFFTEGNEAEKLALYNTAALSTNPAAPSAPVWDGAPMQRSMFISTMGNSAADAGAWGDAGIRLAYLRQYNPIVIAKALQDLQQAVAISTGNALGVAPDGTQPYKGSFLEKAVNTFAAQCEQTAELMTGERFGSAEDFLRAFYRPNNRLATTVHPIGNRLMNVETSAVQTAYSLYSWVKLIPADAAKSEILAHMQGFHTPNTWGLMASAGKLSPFQSPYPGNMGE